MKREITEIRLSSERWSNFKFPCHWGIPEDKETEEKEL